MPVPPNPLMLRTTILWTLISNYRSDTGSQEKKNPILVLVIMLPLVILTYILLSPGFGSHFLILLDLFQFFKIFI